VESREERFRRLYEAGHVRVASYAMRRTLDPEDAADVVAETFAIAWRRIADIPPGDREVPWLYAVARRVIANRVRRSSTQLALIKRLGRELATSRSTGQDPGPDRLSALKALKRLSDDDREILMLVAWDGLTSHELGWVLSCSSTAARIRLYRARTRLNEAWTSDAVVGPHASTQLQEVREP
jgi:RNA polymerase sigma-70 factor (ECF subfamily)